MKRSLAFLLVGVALAGCGSQSGPQVPTVQAAHTYRLAEFRPDARVPAGKPTTVAFAIEQPDGKRLTAYRRGSGPHTGIHLILVRDDLSVLVHRHPPVAPDGHTATTVALPPGKYRVVVDAYPQAKADGQTNFQLFDRVDVGPTYAPKPLPPFRRTVVVDGYRFTIHGNPHLRAVRAGFLTITVTDAHGRPARFTPWYGALAHAIFFRAGTLDYFHTHVCAAGASGCTSALGSSRVAGTSSKPGTLRVGVLVPIAGTWRLFLQTRANGRVFTVPFTLEVT